MRRHAGAGALLLAVLWAGIVIGVSFIATIAKFDAPSLTLPVALDVGRHTFAPLARIEWGLWLALLVAGGLAARSRARIVGIATLGAILALQALWLLPTLDARVELVLAGVTPPPSSLHLLFVGCEMVKIAILGGLAFVELTRLSKPAAG
ncbi:MAG TPA: hypothetical protein PKA13_01325 [Geminicoccaceae bacterium]|nr:hypothetical protein [Geminicoccus sp.]HMU48381.1 hypothetical protein [Geminicoccaceae bacterium]